jgi:hypothetical protein
VVKRPASGYAALEEVDRLEEGYTIENDFLTGIDFESEVEYA